MKLHYLIIWAASSLALFYGTSYAGLKYLALLSLAVVFWKLGEHFAGKPAGSSYSYQHRIYKALDENTFVHRLDLIRECKLPASEVDEVLKRWREQSLVRQVGDVYNITLAGQAALGKQYGSRTAKD